MFSRLLFAVPILVVATMGCGGGPVDASFVPVADPSQKVTLAELRGKPVLIDFWATWCGPCRQTMPIVERTFEKYRSRGLQLIAVSDENISVIQSFGRASGLGYPLYHDTGGSANAQFGVTTIPRVVLIDKSGRVAWMGHPGEEQLMHSKIESVLN